MPSSPRTWLDSIRRYPQSTQPHDRDTDEYGTVDGDEPPLEPAAASTSGSSSHNVTRSPPSEISDKSLIRLEKRREINRRSQQRARKEKQARIKHLETENNFLESENKRLLEKLLQASVHTTTPPPPPAQPPPPPFPQQQQQLSLPTPAPTTASTAPTYGSAQTPRTNENPQAASVDLDACRQAFLAVLASVCDPHLNTIHAVAQKFAQSRNNLDTPNAPTLAHPRPVDRPLNLHLQHHQQHQQYSPESQGYPFPHDHDHNHPHAHPHLNSFESELAAIFGEPSLPSGSYIPSLGNAGPLSVPFFELSHPIHDREFDADGVWGHILCTVDLSRTDAEDLAGRLTGKVRCYGFGPVLMKGDVDEVCSNFPSFTFSTG